MRLFRFKSLGFFVWHGRHEFYHMLLGLVWAWFLRERWNEFNPRWIWLSIFASLLPDLDHVLYYFWYGKHEPYNVTLRSLVRSHQWRASWLYMKNGHKSNTNLASHNIYVVMSLLGLSLLSSVYAWNVGVILFGAMVIHYVFDVGDDLVMLGHINSNWKRWGRGKKRARVTPQEVG